MYKKNLIVIHAAQSGLTSHHIVQILKVIQSYNTTLFRIWQYILWYM